jgi:predicted dehydrogenase
MNTFMEEQAGAGTDKPPVRVGLIGVTGYALAYFEGLTKLVAKGLVEWGAVTIINRDEATEQVTFFESAGIPIFSSYTEMLSQKGAELDWICVPTAIGWHARMTVDALKLGLPVLLEKPIAPTLQDVDIIQRAERASGKLVAIGYQYSYVDETWEIKRRLLEGEIGEIQRIDTLCLWPRPVSYYTRNYWSGRIHDGDSWVLDSPLHNALSHLVNLVLFFAGSTMEGRADPCSVEAELYRGKPIESYDTVRTVAQLDTGIEAAITLSHGSLHRVDPEIRVVGTKGTFVWRFCGTHTFETASGVSAVAYDHPIAIREAMLENVVRRIQGDGSVRICTTEQARGEVKWINAVHDAAPIKNVPRQFRRTLHDNNGEIFDIVEGLEYYGLRAFEERRGFADLGAPWAVRPSRLDCADYRAFEGRYVSEYAPKLAAAVR